MDRGGYRREIKGLLSFSRGIRKELFVLLVIMLLQVVFSLLFVVCSKRVVDIATGNNASPLMPAVLMMGAVMLMQVVCRVMTSVLTGRITINAKNRIRSTVFTKAMRSVWVGQEKFHSADIVNRLEEDIRVVCDFLCTTFPAFFVVCVQLVASSAYLFSLSAGLAWILVFIMPVGVAGSRLFFRKQRALTGEIRGIDGRIQGHMQEHLQHRVVDLTMNSVGLVEDDLTHLQDSEKETTLQRLRYSAFSRAFLSLGFSSGYLLAFLWGVFGLRNGTVTYGLMVAFLQLVGQVQRPVADIASCIPAFIRALASQNRIQDLLDMEQEQVVSSGREIILEGAPGVKVEALSFGYDSRKVIDDLSFDFKPGSFTSIVGETGAGKSTLIRLLLALLKPSQGSITLYDSKREIPCDALSRVNYMYVPQGNTLLSGTIRDNLMLANPSASDEMMERALRIAAADFVFELPSGISTKVSEIGAGLSEGQSQRIAIARALLRPGGILILDEATSALDSATENLVLSNIHEQYGGRKTIICITHRPAATRLSDATVSL